MEWCGQWLEKEPGPKCVKGICVFGSFFFLCQGSGHDGPSLCQLLPLLLASELCFSHSRPRGGAPGDVRVLALAAPMCGFGGGSCTVSSSGVTLLASSWWMGGHGPHLS